MKIEFFQPSFLPNGTHYALCKTIVFVVLFVEAKYQWWSRVRHQQYTNILINSTPPKPFYWFEFLLNPTIFNSDFPPLHEWSYYVRRTLLTFWNSIFSCYKSVENILLFRPVLAICRTLLKCCSDEFQRYKEDIMVLHPFDHELQQVFFLIYPK
jgi:hypothetical protein